MDKKEHLKGNVVEEPAEVEEDYVDLDDITDDINGHAISMDLVTLKKTENPDKLWECKAAITFAITRDKDNWAKTTFPVQTVGSNPDSAISSVMVAFSNKLHDDNIYEELVARLDEFEEEDGEEEENEE